MIKEISRRSRENGESMVGVSRLRSLAGRLSWISWSACVVPRFQWAVNMVYVVVTAVDKDVMEGVEEQRTGRTPRTRRRGGVFTVMGFAGTPRKHLCKQCDELAANESKSRSRNVSGAAAYEVVVKPEDEEPSEESAGGRVGSCTFSSDGKVLKSG